MFTRVVVGVDGREGGRDAAALALLLAEPGGVALVHAYRSPGPRVRLARPDRDADAERAAEELLERERDLVGAPPMTVLQPVAAPTPVAGLSLVAADLMAELIVVGSRHRGALGRVLLGDTPRGLLHHAPCAVAIAPRDYRLRDVRLTEIGVGYDGTPESDRAVTVAAELAREHGTVLWLFGVVPPAEPDARARLRRLDALAENALDRLAPGGDKKVVVSDPTAELERVSRDVDLLCVGARDQGPLHRALLGSVSDHLASTAACPLLVAPLRVPAEPPLHHRRV